MLHSRRGRDCLHGRWLRECSAVRHSAAPPNTLQELHKDPFCTSLRYVHLERKWSPQIAETSSPK
ncbi:hypothetical protein E2C01_047636 [Portunus trituberculatus]|uniref:Uncharacterized protein n=1 Tax=Portunus trituberculatus TaxID=210409 RepID=A0A5B7G8F2_PORTR|nr:hypothetical protein [Portunus trituberculatus]